MPREMTFHRRCRDWEAFDKIELEVGPRYKTSEMSGDEWRTSIAIRFYHKGHLVHEDFRTTMQYAIMLLSEIWIKAQEPISEKIIELERQYCDQPGCKERWGHLRLLKRLATNEGWLAKSESAHRYFRKFCDKHLKRGDCGLEDSDANYELPSEEQS